MKGTPWTEAEVRACIKAYFNMLSAQDAGRKRKKRDVYRALVCEHPARTEKAWEAKCQNISAVLYEENQPYLDGLTPRFNYQSLLRALVLDHLKRRGRSTLMPIEILSAKLKQLWRVGPLPVNGNGTGRYGLTLEQRLGIKPNSSKAPDFMGIELKTKYGATLQTLFSRIPTRWLDTSGPQDLVHKHGKDDPSKGRRTLYTSFNSKGDTLGFSLHADQQRIYVKHGNIDVLEYDVEVLERALLTKLSEAAYISVIRHGGAQCQFKTMMHCKHPSVLKFLQLIADGDVYLDFTLSLKGEKLRDHGYLWRINPSALTKLYLSTATIDLSA